MKLIKGNETFYRKHVKCTFTYSICFSAIIHRKKIGFWGYEFSSNRTTQFVFSW